MYGSVDRMYDDDRVYDVKCRVRRGRWSGMYGSSNAGCHDVDGANAGAGVMHACRGMLQRVQCMLMQLRVGVSYVVSMYDMLSHGVAQLMLQI